MLINYFCCLSKLELPFSTSFNNSLVQKFVEHNCTFNAIGVVQGFSKKEILKALNDLKAPYNCSMFASSTLNFRNVIVITK